VFLENPYLIMAFCAILCQSYILVPLSNGFYTPLQNTSSEAFNKPFFVILDTRNRRLEIQDNILCKTVYRQTSYAKHKLQIT
jgi:hypothetical protein